MYPRKDNWLSETIKINRIQKYMKKIMETLWLDITDDSLSKTPYRVAKMYVKEIFKGLNPKNEPIISTFENKMWYNEMVTVKNIKVMSICEHHFAPFIWEAFIAYIPKDRIIWLSKINRIVDYFARKPQVQERLTEEVFEYLKEKLNTENIAILINAKHLCVAMRWIQDLNSNTTTTKLWWIFMNNEARNEFLALIK